MASRDIIKCTPRLRELFIAHQQAAKAKGIDFVLTCTARLLIEQEALWAQGRETLAIVNAKRLLAKMPPITAVENRSRVTWTMNSKHIITPQRPLAEAYDIVIVKDGQAQWSVKTNVNKNDIPDYIELAAIGRSVGLKPGADFSKPDYPHYEV